MLNLEYTFHDVDQNSDQWFQMRSGKMTSSNLGKVMASYGKPFGEPAKKYAVDIAIGQITGKAVGGGYSNEHMQRGTEQEPIARMLYETEMFCDVSNGGFFDLGFVGCSPDGMVFEDGLIEIKCVIPSVHYANIKRAKVDPAYKWQCFGNLMFTGREWIDFVSYCADFPIDKQLYIHRMHKEDYQEEFKQISNRLEDFELLVAESKKTIEESDYIN